MGIVVRANRRAACARSRTGVVGASKRAVCVSRFGIAAASDQTAVRRFCDYRACTVGRLANADYPGTGRWTQFCNVRTGLADALDELYTTDDVRRECLVLHRRDLVAH